jgi:molybdopterin/thiamine biosynthesis adenylyltransferase
MGVDKRIVIVGIGALGSHVILSARNWKGTLVVVDFDRVEAKNIQSQFHTRLAKGKNKATALCEAARNLFGRPLVAYPSKVNVGNVEELLGSANLVIDCTDNIAAREVIQTFCAERIACLHGCLSADGSLARVVWTEDFKPDSEGGEGGATCEDGENLAFHMMAGSMVARVAQDFLKTGKKRSWQLTPYSMVRIT